jgi:hypothetical protein
MSTKHLKVQTVFQMFPRVEFHSKCLHQPSKWDTKLGLNAVEQSGDEMALLQVVLLVAMGQA